MVKGAAISDAPSRCADAGGGQGVGEIPVFDARTAHRRSPWSRPIRADRVAPAGGRHAGRRSVEVGPAAYRCGTARAYLITGPTARSVGRQMPNDCGGGGGSQPVTTSGSETASPPPLTTIIRRPSNGRF